MPDNNKPDDEKPDIIDTTAKQVIGKITPKKVQGGNAGYLPPGEDEPELMVENPSHIISQGMWIILIFFGLFGIWACFGKISGAVVAHGQIRIENERKIVQHLEGGIIDEILVKEGEEVREGQPLVILQSVQADAETNILKKDSLDLEARRIRLMAEKDKLDKLSWNDEIKALAQQIDAMDSLVNEEKIFHARQNTLNTAIDLFRSQLAQLAEQVKGFQSQVNSEGRIIAALNNELASKQRLVKQHYMDKSQILELERNLAAHEGTRARLHQQIAEAKQKAGELNLRIADVESKFLEDTINTLGETEKKIIQTRERLKPSEDVQKRLQILAPVSGKVVDLKIHSHGGVIKSGETLMDIVPHDQPMLIVTKVPVQKITEVYINQKALVQLEAFGSRYQPKVPGKVTYVSADSLEENGQSFYSCYVEVDPDSLNKTEMYISPGMPATVYIMTQDRTIIYYMFEPLIKSWDRALRD